MMMMIIINYYNLYLLWVYADFQFLLKSDFQVLPE